MSALEPSHPNFGRCNCQPCQARAKTWPEAAELAAWLRSKVLRRRPAAVPLGAKVLFLRRTAGR